MKVLLVRLSSLGDVVHTLPAVSDAIAERPDLQLHWLVEPAWAEIAAWHPGVAAVIPAGLRAVKRDWSALPRTVGLLRERLRAERYDLVVDTQGLIKSAMAARLAGAPIAGADRRSAREPLAAQFYRHTYRVASGGNALQRYRTLLAAALRYALPTTPVKFGLDAFTTALRSAPAPAALRRLETTRMVVGLHGTTWVTKQWCERYWAELTALLAQRDVCLALPWGNPLERARAERIRDASGGRARVLPPLALGELAWLLVCARAWVAMDTGLGHLGAALGTPGVMLYGPTSHQRTGVVLDHVVPLAAPLSCAPCLKRACPLPLDAGGAPLCQASLVPQQVIDRLVTWL